VPEQLTEEPLGRAGVAVLLHEHVEHLPALVHRALEVGLPPTDARKHLIEMPGPPGAGSPFP
jgi:hypothetical protein